MRISGLLIAFLLLSIISFGQVVDRYPVIQCPTETSAIIAWRTAASGTGTLHWGTSSGNLTQTLSNPGTTQKHKYNLENLSPNTEYFYQIETSSGFSSQEESFFTAKTIQDQTVSFLHYGDCGYNNTIQNNIASLMELEEVDFAVVAGDVDQGTGDNYDDIFFGVYKNMLARDCHFTAFGNHDIIYDNGATYLDAFYLPTNNPQGSEHYYTFTWGNTKFICMDSNMDYSIGSDQHNWLLDELKCNDREWLFVFFHHPPWTNAWDPTYFVPFQPYYQYDGNDDMRTALVPYFEQYGVDFVLNGHSHCYQRGSLNGVEYVISGGAGTSTLDQRTCNSFPNYGACAPNLSVEIYENHFVKFEVTGDTARYYTINIQGNIIDSLIKVKTWTNYDLDLQVSDVSTAGANDGAVQATANGPHAPYNYSWSTGATGSYISGLSPGTYYVSVTDANGCTRLDSAFVGGLVSQSEPFDAPSISISPNPFQDGFSIITSGFQGTCTYSISDLAGRTLQSGSFVNGEQFVPSGNWASGIYFLQWRSAGHSGRTKMLKL